MTRDPFETPFAYAVRLAHHMHTVHQELRSVFQELDGQAQASLRLLQDELEDTANPARHEPLNLAAPESP